MKIILMMMILTKIMMMLKRMMMKMKMIDVDVDSLLTFKRKCGVDLLAGRQTQAGNCQGLKLEIVSVHNWKLSRFKIGAKSF